MLPMGHIVQILQGGISHVNNGMAKPIEIAEQFVKSARSGEQQLRHVTIDQGIASPFCSIATHSFPR